MRAEYSDLHSERAVVEITLDRPDEIILIHPQDLATAHLIIVTGPDGNRLTQIMPFINAKRIPTVSEESHG